MTNISVALVTGGGSGIGRSAALELARHYDRVLVADLSLDAAQSVAMEIEARGGEAFAVHVDVRDTDSVESMVASAKSGGGKIHVLVHSAGVFGGQRAVLTMSDDEWRDILDVNLTGAFRVTRAVAKHMADNRSGTIVLIASDRGIYGGKNKAHYAASKAGLIAYAKSLALELGEFGVTCNAVNPGATMTPGFDADAPSEIKEKRVKSDPLGRLSTPEDIAEVIGFLARSGGEFITGQLISIRMRVA